jgi:deazaflavin-dependent oxidoreductase (nitroreductase family)
MHSLNANVIAEFRANRDVPGGVWEGTSLLLLHDTGASSGEERINPLGYLGDGGNYVVIASNGGSRNSPHWYRNLKARPKVVIEPSAMDNYSGRRRVNSLPRTTPTSSDPIRLNDTASRATPRAREPDCIHF